MSRLAFFRLCRGNTIRWDAVRDAKAVQGTGGDSNSDLKGQKTTIPGEVGLLTLPQVNAIFERNGAVILDGGLATELEKQGHNLNHDLWSARLLLTDPDAIRNVHRTYLEAGANCITTASYQASFDGLAAAGVTKQAARQLLMDSVSIAQQAVTEFLGDASRAEGFDRPVVAASIGPYGAYLADGSEYRGKYGVPRHALRDFHEERLDTISQAQPDLLACETIPCAQEVEVLRDLLDAMTDAMAWISFSCVDGEHLCDGTPVQQCAALFEDCQQVFAVGVNCTAPQYVKSLIEIIRAGVPGKRIVVYPNSGQLYDARHRIWKGATSVKDFGKLALEWLEAGASLIGGCCQTRPAHIRAIRQAIGNN